jgi:preprotein translocase subunit SecG
MIALVVTIHIVVCLTLVTVVLLQQGKGADVGAVFGGSSQTIFGSSGAGNLLTKVTWGCAIIFFTTSIILAYTSTRRATGSIFEGGRVTLPVAPVGKPALPVKPPATGAPAPGNHPVTPPNGSK